MNNDDFSKFVIYVQATVVLLGNQLLNTITAKWSLYAPPV
jgi:hypothetical protein